MKHYIFADESNIGKEARFMLIGGIWVDETTYNCVKQECKQYKESLGWREDTKFNWKNVSNTALDNYKGFIDIFFKHNLQFNTIIIDKTQVNLRHNEENDVELGFYKFYYLLLWHNSSKSEDEYHIYLDRRNNKKQTRLPDLQKILKNEQYIANGLKFEKEVRGINVVSLEPVNSKDYNLIQFTDILLGAIGFHYNKRHLKPNASTAKIELANYISNTLQTRNLRFSTSKGGYKNLNLWLFEPAKDKASYDLHVP